MPVTGNQYYVPHGLDPTIADHADPSPYAGGTHAVSRRIDAVRPDLSSRSRPRCFPDVTFHVIGPGALDRGGFAPNVRIYDEMPPGETLRYIKHARFGIAPYAAVDVPPYLADTSMKLMQYRFFGIPAVCPEVVTDGTQDRYGYEPRAAESIRRAIEKALSFDRIATPHAVLTWSQATDRLLDPQGFADTRVVPFRANHANQRSS